MEESTEKNSSELEALDLEKKKLEVEKLKKENKELEKAWFKKPQWWSIIVPTFIGLITIVTTTFLAYKTGIINISKLEAKVDTLTKKRQTLDSINNILLNKNYSLEEKYKVFERKNKNLQFTNNNLVRTNINKSNQIDSTVIILNNLAIKKNILESEILDLKRSLSVLSNNYTIYKEDAESIKSFYIEVIKADYATKRKIYNRLISTSLELDESRMKNNELQIELGFLRSRINLTENEEYQINLRNSAMRQNYLKGVIPEFRPLKDFDEDFQTELRQLISLPLDQFMIELRKKGIQFKRASK